MKITPISFCLPQNTKKNFEKKSQVLNAGFSKDKHINSSQIRANLLIPFTSLKRRGTDGKNDFCDTYFYRDLYTMLNACRILNETFPNGADIMDFACSNGEEAISIHSLINDKDKINYNIYGYDKNPKAVELAKNGVYSVFNIETGDDFLLDKKQKNSVYEDVTRCFYEIMEETKKPDYEINDKKYIDFLNEVPDFKIKYFKIKDEYKNSFNFESADINDIKNLKPEKAGAIFFRNAVYILTNNYSLDEFQVGLTDTSANKEAIINDLVDKVYDKLLPGGIFVLGSSEKEHIFLADDYTPIENTMFVDGYMTYVCKKSPLEAALEKDGRFKPVLKSKVWSTLDDKEIMVPTIWQKVK